VGVTRKRRATPLAKYAKRNGLAHAISEFSTMIPVIPFRGLGKNLELILKAQGRWEEAVPLALA